LTALQDPITFLDGTAPHALAVILDRPLHFVTSTLSGVRDLAWGRYYPSTAAGRAKPPLLLAHRDTRVGQHFYAFSPVVIAQFFQGTRVATAQEKTVDHWRAFFRHASCGPMQPPPIQSSSSSSDSSSALGSSNVTPSQAPVCPPSTRAHDPRGRLTPLNADVAALVDQVLNIKIGPGTPDIELTIRFDIPLMYSKVQCLLPNRCLNDDVMNMYLQILMERCQQESRRYVALTTFFYAKLLRNGRYAFAGVSTWFKHIKLTNVQRIYIPIHYLEESHWCLVCIDLERKQLLFYDPFVSSYHAPACLANMRRFLRDLAVQQGFQLNMDDWVDVVPTSYPRQAVGTVDCGVFVLIYADFLSDDVDLATLRFTQEDVDLLRRKIVLELVVERETPGTGPPCEYHLLVQCFR
jgi:hypothetical protein